MTKASYVIVRDRWAFDTYLRWLSARGWSRERRDAKVFSSKRAAALAAKKYCDARVEPA